MRTLRRRPAFTLAAVISLALGIGANTAIFSLLNALLMKSLPVDRPGELVQVVEERREKGGYANTFAYPVYDRLRRRGPIRDPFFECRSECASRGAGSDFALD